MPRRKNTAAPLEVEGSGAPTKTQTRKAPSKKFPVKTVKARAKKSAPPSARAGMPRVAPPPTGRLSTPVSLKRTMNAMECFVYGAVVCLVGTVGLGLLLGLVVLPPLIAQYTQSPYSYAAPLSESDTGALQSPAVSRTVVSEQEQYGFYGTLLSKEEDVLTIQELLPPLPLEEGTLSPSAKTFIVRVSADTEYTHQKPREKDDLTAPLFSPEQGSPDALQPQLYVFVNTLEDPTTTDTVNAQHILYSELSPFTE